MDAYIHHITKMLVRIPLVNVGGLTPDQQYLQELGEVEPQLNWEWRESKLSLTSTMDCETPA